MTFSPDSIDLLATKLEAATIDLHLACQMLAEGTKDQFGLLIQGSARLDIRTEVGQRLDGMVRRLASTQTIGNLVTGGGPGLMEVANRAAKQCGVRSWGVGITLAHEAEMPHFQWHDHYVRAGTLEPRLLVMGAISDAVLFARPGIGTAYELFWWLQRCQYDEGKFNNPYPWNPRVKIGFELRPKLICVGSVYDFFEEALDKMADEYGTIKPEDKQLLTVVATYEEAEVLIRDHHALWNQRRNTMLSAG